MTRRRRFASLLLTTLPFLALPLALAPSAASAAPSPADDPAPVSVVGAPNQVTGVNDFVFSSLDVEYELGRDDDGRSTLRTVEHFVAVFPDYDQNRGMIRAIPALYDGHSTRLDVVSVTDETGAPREFELGTDGDFRTITIAVPLGQYVYGEQHYVIEYTQQDVTKYFADTNDDEFYWDVNGTGWAQPFGRVSATVSLAPGLSRAVTETACYQGWEGSTDRCEVIESGETVSVLATDLGAYQNVTVVVAFTAGTFAAAPWDPFALIPAIGVVGVAVSLLSLIYAGYIRFGRWRDEPGRGTVIAQYEPPEGVSLFLAAEILGRKNKAMPSTILDLAVRHWVRIRERDGSWGRTEFGIEALEPPSGDALLPDEARILAALSTSRENGVKWLKKNDTALGRKVIREVKSARTLAVKSGLRRKPSRGPVWIVVLAAAVAFVLCMVSGTSSESEPAVAFGVLSSMAVLWIGIIVSAALGSRNPRTAAGSELKEHLEGLAEFIRWAEADRLQMLQSVTGAERIAVDGGIVATRDRERVVRVYERLLPYAVLFGLEKQWASELSKFYADESPDWYSSSHGTFTVAGFAAGVSSFSSTVSSSYSGSASSSSSGGSGGGGSSGGGGGGGGGGI
ncbi:DUF2207 domain-containing protein [uncultured Schumannella sp.]|uniref:DUF2207 domain-containing protein n=1 Tax=uncultured Schumannella sp. TaxID=1195956 RepID=UPI0025FA2032|nr:DUF2207 domain-containing protein [uncultured Schumannella sp.]